MPWRRRSVDAPRATLARERVSVNSSPTACPSWSEQLHLTELPLVPEVHLFLSDDTTVLWARMEAAAGRSLPAPFWASAWIGGQALARYVLDHQEAVAGRHVLDLGSGSGLVAIAAALADAATVTANDIDPHAIAAVKANARVNGVVVDALAGDILDGDGNGADVLLVGDALYNASLADRVLPLLARAADRGADILVGDPDRGHLSHDWLEVVMRYRVPAPGAAEDAQIEWTNVLAPRADRTRVPASGAGLGPGDRRSAAAG